MGSSSKMPFTEVCHKSHNFATTLDYFCGL
jgi:hypothetical protein